MPTAAAPQPSAHLPPGRRCRPRRRFASPASSVCAHSMAMNGCGGEPASANVSAGRTTAVSVRHTRALDGVAAIGAAVAALQAAAAALEPASTDSGIIRVEVPIAQRVDAVEWLHAQRALPRCFFSARGAPGVSGASRWSDTRPQRWRPVNVAGVGSAVYFQRSEPFSIRDWRAIRRFLPPECSMIRAYGAIRFDARSYVSAEWRGYGSFYFMIPMIELDEQEEGSVLAMMLAWDESLGQTWRTASTELQETLLQISPHSLKLKNSSLGTDIVSLNHAPSEAYWSISVNKALEMIRSRNSALAKVVLARCSRYITDVCVDPAELLACLKVEGQNAYQFCIQPPDSPAFVGNSPEQLFHRKNLKVYSEALAGTRGRGATTAEDLDISQDLLSNSKEDTEFTIVRESIRKKLEIVCDKVVVNPSKALRKLPRVQHLAAQLSGAMRCEDDEFEVLNMLHPTPAVCGLPTEPARLFIQENESFDRGMYAGPVGWFGGAESEFAVGIRSALLGKGNSTLVYAGAGIVEGTNPSSEWDELDLKASQFAKLLLPQICQGRYHNAKNISSSF